MSRSEIVRHVLRRTQPGRFVYAPNYWQWFAHHRHHGTLPDELRPCRTQLDMIRHLGLDVFSRNIYCDQTRGWFGGLAGESWDGVDVEERRFTEGRDTITERTYQTRAGTLSERLRYVFAESTLVQEGSAATGLSRSVRRSATTASCAPASCIVHSNCCTSPPGRTRPCSCWPITRRLAAS